MCSPALWKAWSISSDTASSTLQSQLLTHTRPYVRHGHEAVIAQTTVTPWHVGALAAFTDVRVLLTLIHIWGEGGRCRLSCMQAGMEGEPQGAALKVRSPSCVWAARLTPRSQAGGGAHPPTCTRPPIRHQRVAVSTAAPVAALSVNTVPITPSTPSKAFVDVCRGQGKGRGAGLGEKVTQGAALEAEAEVSRLRLGPGAGGVTQPHPRSPGGRRCSGSRCGRSIGRCQ